MKKKPNTKLQPNEDGTRWCQNCRKHIITRPRKLCTLCYYDKDIRCKFKTWPGYYPHGAVGWNPDAAIEPTEFPPGSEGKIKVMRARAEQMGPLHHALDAGFRERIKASQARRKSNGCVVRLDRRWSPLEL